MDDLVARPAADVRDEDEGVDRLLGYLHSKTNGKRLPKRSEIKPNEIKDIIADICILQPVYDDSGDMTDVMVRLLGTNVTSFYGEQTGKSVTAHPSPDVGPRVMHCVRAASSAREPLLMEISSLNEDQSFVVTLKGVYVPMSEDGAQVDRVMVYLRVFREPAPQTD